MPCGRAAGHFSISLWLFIFAVAAAVVAGLRRFVCATFVINGFGLRLGQQVRGCILATLIIQSGLCCIIQSVPTLIVTQLSLGVQSIIQTVPAFVIAQFELGQVRVVKAMAAPVIAELCFHPTVVSRYGLGDCRERVICAVSSLVLVDLALAFVIAGFRLEFFYLRLARGEVRRARGEDETGILCDQQSRKGHDTNHHPLFFHFVFSPVVVCFVLPFTVLIIQKWQGGGNHPWSQRSIGQGRKGLRLWSNGWEISGWRRTLEDALERWAVDGVPRNPARQQPAQAYGSLLSRKRGT
jgi:hypothetical protein